MASKIKVTPQKEEMLEKEGPETQSDRPLLDLSDAAVKELIRNAKKRGYVTHDQIDALLSSEEVKSEQIEDILANFSEMGVNVVDTKEAELEEEVATGEEPEKEAEGETRASRSSATIRSGQIRGQESRRAHRRPRAHVSPRNELGGTAFARGRDRHRQAYRGRPRGHDRGALREPAHLPGHHYLAGRAQRGQGLPARHHRPRCNLCRP